MTTARRRGPQLKRVLVTGALGFVGLNIVRRLAQGGWRVSALTRRDPDEASERFLGEAGARVRWVQGDVTDRPGMMALVAREGVSHLLHAAALTATPEEERAEPARGFDVNAGGTLNLLEAARVAGLKRVVFVSSSGIYGAAPPTPLKRETEALVIDNLYTVAKQASEQLCRRYQDLYGLSVVVGRLGTAYGPMERVTGSRRGMSRVYQAIHGALEGRALTVYGASVSRDYCHVYDVAEAFAALLEAEVLNHNIYNVGGEGAEPLRAALEAIGEALPSFQWREVACPEEADLVLDPEKARAGLDLGRLRTDTPWRAHFDLRTGVKAYIDWLREERS
ncbi:MAG: NAD(P)-dependent oxidoreductase [Truepera sp.]|nr:NAD(P)-dependent oxidoreductase [Truepera sp.]